jgi:hypothetical protein
MNYKFLINSTYCPFCNHYIDTASQVDSSDASSKTPTNGSLNICLYCANISIFNENLKLEKIAPEQLETILAEDSDLKAYVKKLQTQIAETIIEREIKKLNTPH